MPFEFDGGSSLTVDEYRWIVGAEAIEREMKAGRNITWRQAIKTITTGIDREPIVLGVRFKDLPHKTRWVRRRFVSTLNDRLLHDLQNKTHLQRLLIIAMAGASAARSVVRDLTTRGRLHQGDWSHIDMVVSVTGIFRDGKPVLLVGDPTLPGCPLSEKAKDRKAELDSMVKVIDKMKAFWVIRNPTPVVDGHLLGYNNTIVQTNPHVVMLPVFSGTGQNFDIVDRANVKLWEDLGFRVVQVPCWMAFTASNGCIRCATLPLERSGSDIDMIVHRSPASA